MARNTNIKVSSKHHRPMSLFRLSPQNALMLPLYSFIECEFNK